MAPRARTTQVEAVPSIQCERLRVVANLERLPDESPITVVSDKLLHHQLPHVESEELHNRNEELLGRESRSENAKVLEQFLRRGLFIQRTRIFCLKRSVNDRCGYSVTSCSPRETQHEKENNSHVHELEGGRKKGVRMRTLHLECENVRICSDRQPEKKQCKT